MLARVELVHARAQTITGPGPPYRRTRYSLGGGHPGFGPSMGEEGVGLDCSGLGSDALKAGGLLADPPARFAFVTADFLRWGQPGPGHWLTVYVRNDVSPAGVHHMRLGFTNNPAWPHRFVEAPHPGEYCWWFDGEPTGPDFDGMTVLHWPGT